MGKRLTIAVLLLFNRVPLCFSSVDEICPPRRDHWMHVQTRTFMRDLVDIHRQLFSKQTLHVALATVPLYAVSRPFEEHVHHCFYDAHHHKNIHQVPCKLREAVHVSLPIVLTSLAILPQFSSDQRFATIGSVFAKGLLTLWGVKSLIKNVAHADCCLRPRCEFFDPVRRSHRGFPSGHVAAASYMTTVFGGQYGLKAGLPLGIYSAFVMGVSLSENRHYLSQMIAGAALGIAYGLATNAVIDLRLEEHNVAIVPYCDPHQMGLEVSYEF